MLQKLKDLNIITPRNTINNNLHKLVKKYPAIFDEVLELTSFCRQEEVTWKWRIYCIQKDIKHLPLCKTCNKSVLYSCIRHQRLVRYCGPKCFINNPETQEKLKQTNLKRYGVEWNVASKQSREKSKQTCLERYGVNNPFKVKNIKEKIKETNLQRYGVEYSTQNRQIKEKIKETNLQRYGVEHPSQSKEIKEKVKQTCLERYGVNNPSQSKDIKEKSKQTNLKRYGVNYPWQKHMITNLPFLNHYAWLTNEHHIKQKSLTQIGDELGIDATTVGNYLKKYSIEIRQYGFSNKSILWLETIMKEQDIFIQHAQNIGEYRIPGTRLHVDGYCRETNTIYEFYGDFFHGNPEIYCSNFYNERMYKTAGELYQKTIKRENKIKKSGYNFIVIWEKDFNG
ncbi:MAG: DUF7487 domain-containing protein [Nitrosopumilaceae archaeon]